MVVVNAEVTVAYDLSKINFDVDEEHQTLYITDIPAPEIKIFPDLKYYDISGDYLNPFNANDFNKIKDEVHIAIGKRIDNSNLKENAENRLISELSRFYVLTNSLGWKLVYNKQTITDGKELEKLNFHWMEEPMDESSMSSYIWLSDQLDLPILGPETMQGKLATRAEWITNNACDILRGGVGDVGGLTPLMKIIHLAESFNMALEVHGGGAGNLHALLSMAIPGELYERGLLI